ncbi:MAG: ribonuclease P protein component [Treponema sp.]|jgi:ribonuclease P protein component|nr:ribonuclease P protein component [Treponema sp.]
MRKSPINTERHQFRFKREERLKKRDEIRAIFNQGKAVSCSGAKLLILKNGLPINRLAVTFARKFGNAVKRNRTRRVSREAYRMLKKRMKTGFDLALLVYPVPPPKTANTKQKAAGKDCLAARMGQFQNLFNRAGLFMENW